jgi:hypothetical protein
MKPKTKTSMLSVPSVLFVIQNPKELCEPLRSLRLCGENMVVSHRSSFVQKLTPCQIHAYNGRQEPNTHTARDYWATGYCQ